MKTVRTLSSNRFFSGRVFNVRRDIVRVSGKERAFDVVEAPETVAVLPVLDDGRILMVQQYRHSVGKSLFEIPGGIVDKGEDPAKAAVRELEEETGYTADKIEKLLTAFPAPAYSSEQANIYVAKGLNPSSSKNKGDEDEIMVQAFTVQDILTMVTDGRVQDFKTILAVLYYLRTQDSSRRE